MIRSGGVEVEGVNWSWGSLFSPDPDGFTKSAVQKVCRKTTAREANLCFLLCVLPFLDVVWCGSVVAVVVSGTSIVLLPGFRTRN